jgi:STE20-like kinase
LNQLHHQPDPSNSLASQNVSQITVVTSHPPVIIDNSGNSGKTKLTKSVSAGSATNEVVIVSNETNKSQHINESSTDDDYQSYDSLESSPKHQKQNQKHGDIIIKDTSNVRPRKLDESEVLIVSPDGIFEDDLDARLEMLDTSHVSVVTVGDEQVKVKDSSHLLDLIEESECDLSNLIGTERIELDSNSERSITPHNKTNGQIINNLSVNNNNSVNNIMIVNRSAGNNLPGKNREKRISPDSSVDCSSSMDSPTLAQSENGSVRSSNHDGSLSNSTKRVGISISNKLNDRSDAESISTTSHDSRDQSDDVGEVQLRRKPEPQIPESNSPVSTVKTRSQRKQEMTPRTKEEIHLQNLKKKTRKRTRKFEIDGVQVTTTTSKVIYGDEENGRLYDDHIFRKQELRELKLLQKQEKKQFYDLQAKEQIAKEQQDKKFDQERLALERTYEADMEVLARQHRQTVEKYEQQQENELRNTSKRIRAEQERELKLVSVCLFLGVAGVFRIFFEILEVLKIRNITNFIKFLTKNNSIFKKN